MTRWRRVTALPYAAVQLTTESHGRSRSTSTGVGPVHVQNGCICTGPARPSRYSMTGLHATEVEIIAQAHSRLTSGGTTMKSPTDACESELDEVIHEADSVPGNVVRARDACQADDADRAERLLTEFLSGTNYDPNDPDSYHPDA